MLPSLKSIRSRRNGLGLTQHKLASLVGISQSLLTKIERGIVVPNYEIAGRIFEFLDRMEHRDEKLAVDLMHKGVITVDADYKISKVTSLVKKYAVSQFPVVGGGKIIGSLTTKSIMGAARNATVKDFTSDAFPTVNETTPRSSVIALLKHHPAVVVTKNGTAKGIITAEDLL